MNHAAKKGFTIIELMLAMSFIAVLLLGIAQGPLAQRGESSIA